MLDLPLKYLMREPRDGDARSAPTLVLLHGLRSNEDDLMGLAPELDPQLRIVSVRAPVGMGPSAYAWYPVEFLPGGDFSVDVEVAQRSLEQLVMFLRALPSAVGADPERVYCGGFSQGAVMTLAATVQDPGLMAGILCLSGRLPPTGADSARLEGLPAMVVHGTEDPVIPVRYGREVRDFLTSAEAAVTWREYPMGHYVNAASLRDVRNWLSERLAAGTDWRQAR